MSNEIKPPDVPNFLSYAAGNEEENFKSSIFRRSLVTKQDYKTKPNVFNSIQNKYGNNNRTKTDKTTQPKMHEVENHETINGRHYASFFVSRDDNTRSYQQNEPPVNSRDNDVYGIRQHFTLQGGPLHYQYTLSHVTLRWSGSQIGSEHSLQEQFFPAEVSCRSNMVY